MRRSGMGKIRIRDRKKADCDPGYASRIHNTSKSYSSSSGDTACRIPSTQSMSWKEGKASKSCSSSAETSSSVCRPPSRCPVSVRAIFLQCRHCLSNTLHQINVLEKRQESKSCCSSAETSSSVCRPPSQCPGTGETLPVEYPPPNQCPGRKEKRVRVEFLSRDIVFCMSSTQSVSWEVRAILHRVETLPVEQVPTLNQINVLEKRQASKSCFSSAETSSSVCPLPSQCPGTGESELFFFEWRHCL